MELIHTVHQTVCDTMAWSIHDVHGHTLLQDCPGWDSVNQLRVLLALESATSVRIPLKRFLAAHTIEQMAVLVKSLDAQGASA